jgi:hypothetical protein
MSALLDAALKAIPPGDAIRIVAQYGPALGEMIAAVIQFMEKQEDDKLRATSMDSFTRGLQIAKETGDTSQLEAAIRGHCSASGCRLP